MANVDLETGKRFAPYFDRADRPRFAAWQTYQNLRHGLADPQEPDRRRAIAPASRFLSPEAKGNATQLNKALERLCAQGEFRNRDDIVRFLTERVGVKVPRHGKDYITVQYGEGKHDRFRLRATYEANLNAWLSEEERTLASEFEPFKSALNRCMEQMTSEVKKDARRMLWLMKVPLLFIVAVCAVTMVLEVSWFRSENRDRVHLVPWVQNGQKYMILDEPGWSLYTTGTTELHEMGKDGKTRSVTAVLQEPCRPVE